MDSKESSDSEENTDNTTPIILRIKTNSDSKPFACTVCPSSYTQTTSLKYHIRKEHYNMIAKITGREKREINECWHERVPNSDAIIEIKKTGPNKYLMTKAIDTACVLIAESQDTIDLSPLYPDCGKLDVIRAQCSMCKKKMSKTEFRKHLEEVHDNQLL